MPALNYIARLAPLVESGAKLQTIRAPRKVPINPGDTLYHFTGMRTKDCRRLGVSTCASALGIDIIRTPKIKAVFLQVGTGGGQYRMSNTEIADLAQKDGFPDTASFWAWFTNLSTHFTGNLIKWPEIKPNAGLDLAREEG